MNSENMKILIVGYGNISKRHIRNLKHLYPRSEIILLRSNPDAKDNIEDDNIDVIVPTLEKALQENPFAALIASPAPFHVEVAKKLAENSVHLFIEKPISNNTGEVNKLINLCSKNNVKLMIGYVLRFTPSLIKFKSLLEEKKVGEVLSVRAEIGQFLPDWRKGVEYKNSVSAKKSLGGGAVLELSHELDYITWLFSSPEKVQATIGHYSNLEIDVEDLAEINLAYKNVLINIHLDMLQRIPVRTCKVIGSEGTMIWDFIEDVIKISNLENNKFDEISEYKLSDKNYIYINELKEFFNAIEEDRKPSIGGDQGLKVLELVEAIKLSAAESKSVWL
jgi:predicted dehydrogenase